MLPLGRLGKGFGHEWETNFTKEEQITMMTLWCVFGSPLMIGAELTLLDDWTLSLLTRPEVLKLLSNDYVGRQVERDDEHAVWSCYNSKIGERYLALFNFKESEQRVSTDLKEVEQFLGTSEGKKASELWSGETETITDAILSAAVPAHGAKLYRIEA